MKYWGNYPFDKHLTESYDSVVEEKKIQDFWSKKQTFKTIQSNRRTENDGTFSFHYGPPFPTGFPHSGHILNGVMKDIFTRFGYQKNQQVVSQFGWDCHGLPVEHEVNKKLGIKGPEDFQKIGITSYNEECRKFVQRHQEEWKNVFDRLGIWVDFTNTYSTMSMEYIEGVWSVFKQLYDKGLVYRDTKVLPYSTGCFSHLSNFEAEMNWKEFTEVSATISVNIVDSCVRLLIWTMTPWTLFGNVAIGVNPSSKYVKVKMISNDNVYILSKNRLQFVFGNPGDYVLVEEIQGKELEGLRYRHLLHNLSESVETLQVLVDECIRDDVGTGIVALSPHFSEGDYHVCMKNGITLAVDLCPIDDSGCFKTDVSGVAGLSIKEGCDVVIKTLRKLGHLVHLEEIKHKKPHCWRSEVPLINKTVSTWFIRVKTLTPKILENNSEINWLPCSLKGTMDNQFTHCIDWSFARNKYWGTPIPIWSSPSGDEVRCLGSIDELLQLTGVTSISGLHREFVDELEIPSIIPGNPPLRRVPEVFDCWFESGAMPFIQKCTQADLIAEGLDQTNGWFYTTSILSAALEKPLPSNNIMAHGLVKASDGSKISKRKHNYSDPVRMAEKYGADALRLYLVTSPLVTSLNFTLDEDEVRKMAEKVIEPIYKVLHDLMPYFGKVGWVSYGVIIDSTYYSNIFDIWILSCLESLKQFCDTELTAHRLHLVIPRLIEFIEVVQDWYIPIRRKKGTNISNNDSATFILYNIVFKTCIMLAPFAPFFTEHIYQIFQPWVGYYRRDFIHDVVLPDKTDALINSEVEVKITRWKMVVEMVREFRVTYVIPIEYRISELIVVTPADSYWENDELLDETLMKIANVHQIRTTNDQREFGATLKANLKTNSCLHRGLSPSELEEMSELIRKLNDTEVKELIRKVCLNLKQHNILLNDVEISYQFDKTLDKNVAVVSRNELLVVIKMNKDLNYYEEGTRLAIVGCIQKLRKKRKMFSSEHAHIGFSTKDSCIRGAFEKFREHVSKVTNSTVNWTEDTYTKEKEVVREIVDIKGVPVTFYLDHEKCGL